MKRVLLRPTLDDLDLFRKICGRVQKGAKSLRRIAVDLGESASVLTNSLKRLQKDRVMLLETQEGGGILRITPEGKDFLEDANQILESHGRLTGKSVRRLAVGTTDTFVVHLMPGTWLRRYSHEADEVDLKFYLEQTPQHLLGKLNDGDIEFGIGSALPTVPKGVIADTFKDDDGNPIGFDRFLVCSPTHRLATAISEGRLKSITLDDLKDEDIAYRSQERHPSADRIPEGKGKRLEVDTYDAIVAFARLGVASGIVPGFPWWLDPLRTEGALVYVRVDGAKRSIPTMYLRAPREELSAPVQKLIKAMEEHLRLLPRTLAWEEVKKPVVLPVSRSFYEGLKHVYYVSHAGKHQSLPLWFTAKLSWTVTPPAGAKESGRGKKPSTALDVGTPEAVLAMRGEMVTHDGTRYTLFGTLLGTEILSVTGVASYRGREDRFVAVFNAVETMQKGIKDGTCLLGIWVGRDESGRATSSPMLVSHEPITNVEQLRDITHCSQCNFLLNAASTLDDPLAEGGEK